MEAALIAEGSGGEAISRFFCSPFGGRQKSAVHFSLKKLRAQGDELSMRRFWELCLLPDFLVPPYLGVGVRTAGSFTKGVENLYWTRVLNAADLGEQHAPRLPHHLEVGAHFLLRGVRRICLELCL